MRTGGDREVQHRQASSHAERPLPPGSCARTMVSYLRTSCCRLESSQSSGRTWVCPGSVRMGSRGYFAWVLSRDSDGGLPLPITAGRMYLFYGNKTSVQFQNFTPTVVHPGDLQTHILSAWPRPWLQAHPSGSASWEGDRPRSRPLFSPLT